MFPFTYQGENFETCTKKNAESFWCGTKVDSDGNQIYGQWDYCSGDCSEFLSIKELFFAASSSSPFATAGTSCGTEEGWTCTFPFKYEVAEKGFLKYQIPSGPAIGTLLLSCFLFRVMSTTRAQCTIPARVFRGAPQTQTPTAII